MKIHKTIVLIIGLILLSLILDTAEQSSLAKDFVLNKTKLSNSQIPLQGLKVVNISFVSDDPNVERKIRPDIESRLRNAGLKVISDPEYRRAFEQGFNYPFIMINTGVGTRVLKKTDIQSHTMPVSLELNDIVLLARDPNINFSTVIWSDSASPLFKENDRFDTECETTIKLLTKFLNDYLAANPKDADIKTNQQETK